MNAMKRMVRHPLAIAGVVALLVAGCIVSGQFVLLITWGGLVSTNTVLNAEFIDLTSEDLWNDHKDDIQSIVDVKFEVMIDNNLGSAATGEVYVSDQAGLSFAELGQNATRILFGIEIPANSSVKVEFNESTQYQENLQTLLDLVETGQFYLYGVAANTPFSIEVQQGSRLLVTFAAG